VLARFDGVEMVGRIVGNALSPYLYDFGGYYGCYGARIGCTVAAALYLALVVREPKGRQDDDDEKLKKEEKSHKVSPGDRRVVICSNSFFSNAAELDVDLSGRILRSRRFGHSRHSRHHLQVRLDILPSLVHRTLSHRKRPMHLRPLIFVQLSVYFGYMFGFSFLSLLYLYMKK